MTLILFWNIKWLFVRFTFCHRTTVTLDTQWQNAHTFLERIKLWQKINLTNNHLIFQNKIGVILCENNWRLIWHIIQHTALASSYWTTKNKGYGFYWPTLYTPCSKKKPRPLMSDNNFGKCGPIFKILSPGDSEENYLCTYRKDFHLTCNMYLVKIENPKNVTKFSCWTWQLICLTKI